MARSDEAAINLRCPTSIDTRLMFSTDAAIEEKARPPSWCHVPMLILYTGGHQNMRPTGSTSKSKSKDSVIS
jgi:hypothetical protein